MSLERGIIICVGPGPAKAKAPSQPAKAKANAPSKPKRKADEVYSIVRSQIECRARLCPHTAMPCIAARRTGGERAEMRDDHLVRLDTVIVTNILSLSSSIVMVE